jgi:hypothetical protein
MLKELDYFENMFAKLHHSQINNDLRMMQFCKHVFPEFTISDMLILCSTAAVEMGYFTTYEFQCHNIMSLKFMSQVFTCAVL